MTFLKLVGAHVSTVGKTRFQITNLITNNKYQKTVKRFKSKVLSLVFVALLTMW
jgi:hypothetical protein